MPAGISFASGPRPSAVAQGSSEYGRTAPVLVRGPRPRSYELRRRYVDAVTAPKGALGDPGVHLSQDNPTIALYGLHATGRGCSCPWRSATHQPRVGRESRGSACSSACPRSRPTLEPSPRGRIRAVQETAQRRQRPRVAGCLWEGVLREILVRAKPDVEARATVDRDQHHARGRGLLLHDDLVEADPPAVNRPRNEPDAGDVAHPEHASPNSPATTLGRSLQPGTPAGAAVV